MLEREFEQMKTSKNAYQNSNQWWDIAKIRDLAVQRSKEISAEKKRKIQTLMEEIKTEKKRLDKNKEKIKSLLKQAQELENVAGIFVRTKQTIVEEGETPSKAMFQMEKNNQNKKTIKEIRCGNFLYTDTKNIQKTIRKFYKELYKKQLVDKREGNAFLDNFVNPLTDDENGFLNIKFSNAELRNAAFSLVKGKTPGIDGIPIELYQEYWDLFGEELTSLANEICSKRATNSRGASELH